MDSVQLRERERRRELVLAGPPLVNRDAEDPRRRCKQFGMLTDRRAGDNATDQLASPPKLGHDAAGIFGWHADAGAISVDELVGSAKPEGELDVGIAQRDRE